MFTNTCILMLNNGMPPRVAGNRLSSCLYKYQVILSFDILQPEYIDVLHGTWPEAKLPFVAIIGIWNRRQLGKSLLQLWVVSLQRYSHCFWCTYIGNLSDLKFSCWSTTHISVRPGAMVDTQKKGKKLENTLSGIMHIYACGKTNIFLYVQMLLHIRKHVILTCLITGLPICNLQDY